MLAPRNGEEEGILRNKLALLIRDKGHGDLERAIQLGFPNISAASRISLNSILEELYQSIDGSLASQSPTLLPDDGVEAFDEDLSTLSWLDDKLRHGNYIIQQKLPENSTSLLGHFETVLNLLQDYTTEHWPSGSKKIATGKQDLCYLPAFEPVRYVESLLRETLSRSRTFLGDLDDHHPITREIQDILCEVLELQFPHEKGKLEEVNEFYHKSFYIKKSEFDAPDRGQLQWKIYNGLRLAYNRACFEKEYSEATRIVKAIWPDHLSNEKREMITSLAIKPLVKLLRCMENNRRTKNLTEISKILRIDRSYTHHGQSSELLEILGTHAYITDGPEKATNYLEIGWRKIRDDLNLFVKHSDTVIYYLSALCMQGEINRASNYLTHLQVPLEGLDLPEVCQNEIRALEAYICLKSKNYEESTRLSKLLYKTKTITTYNILPSLQLHPVTTLIQSLSRSGIASNSLENFEEAGQYLSCLTRACEHQYNTAIQQTKPNLEIISDEFRWYAEVGRDLGESCTSAITTNSGRNASQTTTPASEIMHCARRISDWANKLDGTNEDEDPEVDPLLQSPPPPPQVHHKRHSKTAQAGPQRTAPPQGSRIGKFIRYTAGR